MKRYVFIFILLFLTAPFIFVKNSLHAQDEPISIVPSNETYIWHTTRVDGASNVGRYNSLAIVNGQPAISYWDFTNHLLKYAHFNGSTWDTYTVDSVRDMGVNDVGLFNNTSLAVVNGQPAISYWDYNQELKYARFNGINWEIYTVVDNVRQGWSSSLAVVNGQPAISYYDAYPNYDLKYAHFNGINWEISTVDSDGNVGLNPSLAEVNGQPAISYYDNGQPAVSLSNDLKYARFNGSTWAITTVDSGVADVSSLAEVNGQPAISYYDVYNNDLKYASFNGSIWTITLVDSSFRGAGDTSLAVVNGQPAISYTFSSGYISVLKYARFNGSIWAITTVDDSASSRGDNSLAVVNGQPAISYSAGLLMYATMLDKAAPIAPINVGVQPGGTPVNITQSTGNPTYLWAHTGASSYQILLTGQNFEPLPFGPYVWETLNATRYCNSETCQVDLTELSVMGWLTNGSYEVWLCAENAACTDGGNWQGPFGFNIDVAAAPAPLPNAGTTTTLTWELTGNQTNTGFFQVYLAPTNDIGNSAVSGWFTRAQICGSSAATICNWTLPSALTPGIEYTVYVQSWNPGGLSTGGIQGWAGPFTFTP